MTVKNLREKALALEKAKEAFQKMQKTWWEFAKAIYEIRETKTYESVGYETFKDYCEVEFASTNFKSIMKLIKIVETMGKSIEAKIAIDKSYPPPGFDICYEISKKKAEIISVEDLSRLKRDALDKNLSYHKLRDRVRELLEKKRKEIKEFIKKSQDEIALLEKQLEKEIDVIPDNYEWEYE